MDQSFLIVFVVLLTAAVSYRIGQSRPKPGRSITPSEILTVITAAWALGWLAIDLPWLANRRLPMSLSDRLHRAIDLFGSATWPLLLVLAATWLPRINSGFRNAREKVVKRHPLV